MENRKYCNQCQNKVKDGYVCDSCGKTMWVYNILLKTDLLEDYHFCNNSCALKFLQAEEIKTNPRKNIITGKINKLVRKVNCGHPECKCQKRED